MHEMRESISLIIIIIIIIIFLSNGRCNKFQTYICISKELPQTAKSHFMWQCRNLLVKIEILAKPFIWEE